MSQAAWIVTLGRANFVGGVLAARGNEHVALMHLQSCVEQLEWAVYDRRTPTPPDAVMADCFDYNAASAPQYINPVRFTVYTPTAPCPDLPATTAPKVRNKGKGRVQKLKNETALLYNAAHEQPRHPTEGSVCSGLPGSSRQKCGPDGQRADS